MDNKNISIDTILKDLLAKIKGRPEGEKWSDYFAGGVGQSVLELIGGLGAYDSYYAITNRREGNFFEAVELSTVMAFAAALGYPTNRRESPRFKLKFTAKGTANWNREFPIGIIQGYPVSLTQNIYYQTGEVVETECVVGEWKSQKVATATEFKDFEFFKVPVDNVDNNDKLLDINVVNTGEELKPVRFATEMDQYSVYVKTLNEGLIIQGGDGEVGYKFKVGDEIVLNYVQSTEYRPDTIKSINENLKLNIDVDGFEASGLFRGTDEDSKAKLKYYAPLFFNSHFSMVTPNDFNSIPATYKGLISSSYEAKREIAYRIKLCYLLFTNYGKEGIEKMNEMEKALWLEYVSFFALKGELFGVTDPRRIDIDAKLVVVTKSKNISGLRAGIKALYDQHTYALNKKFHIGEVIADIGKLDEVIRVYNIRPTIDYDPDWDEFLGLQNLEIVFVDSLEHNEKTEPEHGGYKKHEEPQGD